MDKLHMTQPFELPKSQQPLDGTLVIIACWNWFSALHVFLLTDPLPSSDTVRPTDASLCACLPLAFPFCPGPSCAALGTNIKHQLGLARGEGGEVLPEIWCEASWAPHSAVCRIVHCHSTLRFLNCFTLTLRQAAASQEYTDTETTGCRFKDLRRKVNI
uniref:Uncharacterized protein n=1 Tax=Pipistrellus kuhlii TaxID=59472 RepID=A0A7J7XB58_PIPKU|nr:hypothetical protein mPipKuh1_010667 [Pipistrellus kuhlii]